MNKIIVTVICICLGSLCWGEDKGERVMGLAPVDRFIDAFSIDEFIKEIAKEMAVTLPAEKKEEFIAVFVKEVDIDEVEQIFKKELEKYYTDEELRILTEFCSRPAGKTALRKYVKCMEGIMAGIQQEIMRARKKILSKENK